MYLYHRVNWYCIISLKRRVSNFLESFPWRGWVRPFLHAWRGHVDLTMVWCEFWGALRISLFGRIVCGRTCTCVAGRQCERSGCGHPCCTSCWRLLSTSDTVDGSSMVSFYGSQDPVSLKLSFLQSHNSMSNLRASQNNDVLSFPKNTLSIRKFSLQRKHIGLSWTHCQVTWVSV